MPVTINPTGNRAREVSLKKMSTRKQLLQGSCKDEYKKCERIVQSSFNHANLRDASPSNHGFVYACVEAYSKHHHLTIRPEDVWFAILSQLGVYINGNAEELRSIFVSHAGQEHLVVESTWEQFPEVIMNAMSKHMNDPDLPEWIKPDFSTTTQVDVTVACILMMGGMQQYFTYTMTECGLPSVTLLGERNDWQRLLDKIDRIKGMSEQAAEFHSLLKPVLGYFVRSFDEPEASEVLSFWNRIAHWRYMGSGSTSLSGWITVFCFWDVKGRALCGRQEESPYNPPRSPRCDIDGTVYHLVAMNQIPSGYMGVPVAVRFSTKKYRMVAGSVGIRCTSSGQPTDRSALGVGGLGSAISSTTGPEVAGLDSLQPVSGWWIYELNAVGDKEVQEGEKKRSVKKTVKKEVKVEKRKMDSEKDQEVTVKHKKKTVDRKRLLGKFIPIETALDSQHRQS
jgi:hypothetical protein